MINSIQSHTNCTPIKPHYAQSFGRGGAMEATADWLDEIQNGDLSEGSFRGLTNVAEKMHDGPFKTFVKILAIGGTAFVATKVGSARVINNITKNDLVSNNVVLPLTKSVHKVLEKYSAKLEKSPYFAEEEKGFKPLIVKSLHSAIKEIKMYGKRGHEEIAQNLKLKINSLKEESKELGGEVKISNDKKIKSYKERLKYTSTENLIKKATSTSLGTGAGTIAVVQANKDADGNGIPDIAEHEVA